MTLRELNDKHMKKPIRLYDFSAGTAALVLSAYLCLIIVLAGAAAGAANPIPYLAVLVLLVLLFAALCFYYVCLPITLEEDALRKGKVCMRKQALTCTVFYNRRYREMSIRFEDGQRTLIVQATKHNLAKVGAWLGYALEIPEMPGKRKK